MLSSPPPDEAPDARELRGRFFTDLDQLAFALELEAADLIGSGAEDEARTRQSMRLGVRLAQRLVSGVWADEVDLRVKRVAEEYRSRISPTAP